MPKTAQHKKLPAVWVRLLVLAAIWAASAALVYYWRVFYSYGIYPFAALPAGVLTLVLGGVGTLLWGAAWLAARFCKTQNAKAAIAIFCVGLLFCFANPPMETPDESAHYLRAYAISEGHFAFDGEGTYPRDVNALLSAFYSAWTNAHDGSAIKVTEKADGTYTNGEAIADRFEAYFALANGTQPLAKEVTQPIVVMVLPFLPQALGMALARLFGGGALACLYGARIMNLLVYTLLCWFALTRCKRYRPVFFAFMLLPLSLYLAGSCSYDALLTGLTFVVLAYFAADEIRDVDVAVILAAIALLCSVKINNILFLAMPLLLPKKVWHTRFKKWQALVATLLGVLALKWLVDWYGVAMRTGYAADAFDRMLGAEVVNQSAQLSFVLSNPLRFLAVVCGTLFENSFFVFNMGQFGYLDMNIPVVSALCVCVILLAAALSVHEKSSLPRRSLLGLLVLALAYIGAVCAGLYITYTPVGMVRIIGLQPRYFLAAFLMLAVLIAAALSHILEPTLGGSQKTEKAGLWLAASVGTVSALLLFQYYFVGPVLVR